MPNFYQTLLSLLPSSPLQVGTVIRLSGGVATLSLPGGGQAQARGTGAIGSKVFFRNGAIDGDAPNLPVELIDV